MDGLTRRRPAVAIGFTRDESIRAEALRSAALAVGLYLSAENGALGRGRSFSEEVLSRAEIFETYIRGAP